MGCYRFLHGIDTSILSEWYKERGQTWDSRKAFRMYPKTGFVVDGIVAGFAYITNSSVAYLDGFISDPHATKDERASALRKLLRALRLLCRIKGCDLVLANSTAPTLAEHCKALGFYVNMTTSHYTGILPLR